MAYPDAWGTDENNEPLDTLAIYKGPEAMRDGRHMIRERVEREHKFELSGTTDVTDPTYDSLNKVDEQGTHKQGSARIWVGDTDPTVDFPDYGTEDTTEPYVGRVNYLPGTKRLKVAVKNADASPNPTREWWDVSGVWTDPVSATDAASTYPEGVSQFDFDATDSVTGWPLDGTATAGHVTTIKASTLNGFQLFYTTLGATGEIRTLKMRATQSDGGWTSWISLKPEGFGGTPANVQSFTTGDDVLTKLTKIGDCAYFSSTATNVPSGDYDGDGTETSSDWVITLTGGSSATNSYTYIGWSPTLLRQAIGYGTGSGITWKYIPTEDALKRIASIRSPANRIFATAQTYATLYTAMAPAIPQVNDTIEIHGCFRTASAAATVASHATRTGAGEITLYGTKMDTSTSAMTLVTRAITNSAGSNIDVDLSW